MNHKLIAHYKLPKVILFISLLVPFLLAVATLFSNNFVLWYDPARDLLSAWNNLSKPTLIGPTSGISGIFYGPYWIWLLSLGLLFSKNPLIVTFIVATIPYCVIFPLLWFRLDKYFNRNALIICWLLFMFSNGLIYATQLWNPYIAPLLALSVIVLLISSDFTKMSKKLLIHSLITGFLIGLIINFHISFGTAFLGGIGIFFLSELFVHYLAKKTNKSTIIFNELISIGSIIIGIIVSFIPTLLFEARHGFHQTQILFVAFFKFGDIVAAKGLNKYLILQIFFDTFGKLFHLSGFLAAIILFGLISIFIYGLDKRIIIFTEKDKRTLLLLLSLFLGVLLTYFTAKNPVWEYHFVGVDILFLFLLVFLATKLPFIRIGLGLFLLYSTIIAFYYFAIINQNKTPFLIEQEQAVKIISANANNTDYTIYAYSPAIYTYEYTYLFRWLAKKDVPYDPGMIKNQTDTIFLIAPTKRNAYISDFINFRSQQKNYKITKIWRLSNDLMIIKLVKR